MAMNSQKRPWKVVVVGLLAAVLLTGTLVATTPAIGAAPVKIGKIWKKIQKKADKRYYTKKKSDKRYAKKPKIIRGTFAYGTEANSAGDVAVSSISFGLNLPGAPTAHYIKLAAPVPPECAGGSVALPQATPGHLCVFEGLADNAGATRGLTSTNGSGSDVSMTYGSVPFAYSAAAGTMSLIGSWALGTGPGAVWKPVAPSSKPAAKVGR
jgi:hypothetical protein